MTNFDKLTYAGNLENLTPIEDRPNYRFVQGDICDARAVDSVMAAAQPDAIVHFAAESHVDRSILSPEPVMRTNFHGTFTLLEAARRAATARFVHVSTDEVYGSLNAPAGGRRSLPAQSEQPLLRFQGRIRPAGALLLRHLSVAHHRHQGVQ